MVPSDWLCLSVWLTVFVSIVPTMGLTTLRGLAGTEVESKLYTDSLSAWYVTLTSSPLDFLFSLFYRTEDCSKIILKTCVFPSACKITYFCVLVRFFYFNFLLTTGIPCILVSSFCLCLFLLLHLAFLASLWIQIILNIKRSVRVVTRKASLDTLINALYCCIVKTTLINVLFCCIVQTTLI